MKFRKSAFVAAVRLIALFVLMAVGALGIAVYGVTVVEWWKPLVAGAAFGAVVMTPASYLVKRITHGDDSRLNLAVAFVAMTIVGYTAVLGFNYAFADESSASVENTVVVNRFEKTHKKYRRVNRRNVVTGEYRTYHLVVAFDNGFEKELQVNLRTYNRSAVGRRHDIAVQHGALGADVMKTPPEQKK